MASSIPTPLHIIQQDSRYAKQDGWELDDICLCSSGNIAVSGHRPYRYQSYVCIYGSTVDNSDSRDKPTLLYHKQFTYKLSLWMSWRPPRCISFIKPNSTEIVTCRYDEVQVIYYNRDVVLRSRKVNGETRCLSVSESQIFIGLWMSDIVNIYDNDLNRIKSIRLKGIRDDWPRDIAAAADRLYVCTEGYYYRAIVYSRDSGSILTEYTTGQYSSEACSMAVNMQHQIVAVLWDTKQVAVYSINSNNCLVVFNVEYGVSRIRISDNGRIVTGNINTGEVKVFSLTQFFTYDNLKVTLSSLLSDSDQEKLVKYFKIRDDSLKDDRDHSNDSDDNDDSDGMGDGKKKARLLTILEKKGLLQDRNFQDLKQAFSHLSIWNTSIVMSHIDFYQQHTEKNASSDLQTSEDNKSGGKLQLDRFSANWSACDLSTCGNMVVVAGYCSNPNKTSLDFAYKSDSNSWSPRVKTKGFEGVSKSKRIVSFINEHKVVTCCGNVIEIINCDTYETGTEWILQSSDRIATCVTVRKGDVYIGFNKSAKILVLNRELQDKMTVTLNDIKSMWPMDLAALSGKLLVCLTDNSSSQVILCNEENGQTLIEYRNVEDGNETPQSVAACEETDLVGILWATNAEYYEGEPYGHIAVHSLTHGYCLSLVAVSFTVHDFECDCYQGCSSGKRLRLTSEHAVVMDDLGGIKLFSMDQIISFDTWKSGFAHSFSLFEYEMLIAFYQLSIDEIIDKMDEEDLRGGNITAEGKIKSTMRILTEKGYITSTNVTSLKNAFAGLGKLYVDRLHQPLDAYIKYARETCITERPDSVPAEPSDNIVESLLQLQYSAQSQSHNACVNAIYQQGNLSQSYPDTGQLSSQQPPISSLPGPSNRSSSVAGKRVLNESQQLNTDRNGEHGGKRIRISDSDYQAIPQTFPSSSMLHLLQDVSHQIASVSTPSKSLTVVTGSSPVFQGLLPMGTTPLSNGTELPRHVHGASSVISVSPGNQQESQNRLMQSVQHLHEPLSSSFDEHQPVGSHHSGSLTDLHPANQVRGNEHLPPAQQVIRSRAHQVMAAGVSQTFQNREHLVQPCTLMGLAESRNHMPLRSSMPTQPQVVNIEQNSQRCEDTVQLQNAQQIVHNMQQQLPIPQNEMNNTRGRERTEPEVHIANESDPDTQHAPLPSIVVQQDLPDGELQNRLGVTECESIKKDILLACAQMEASVESFQKHQTIVLKGICEKLGCLPSSKAHQLQERPETSLLSMSKDNVSRNVTENEQQAISYLESLQEDDKNMFLAFKNMSDDREELVRRLVEKIFSGEERKNGNTSGTGNFQKLNEDKLQKIRCVVFYMCPIRTRRQFNDRLQDKEWKRMCEVIDTANRHYRQELKRQAKRKETLPKT